MNGSGTEGPDDSWRSEVGKQPPKQQSQKYHHQTKLPKTASHGYGTDETTSDTNKLLEQTPSTITTNDPSNWNDDSHRDKLNATNNPDTQLIKSNMIIYYVRQLFCLLIVIVTTYATYQNMYVILMQ